MKIEKKKKKNKAKAKTKVTISLVEFRAWLEGVEDMQEHDWAPAKDQWKRIREKINVIEDVKITPFVAPVVVPPAPTIPYTHMTYPLDAAGSSLDNISRKPMPPISMGNGAPMSHGQDKVVTPNIDTSDGEYTSSFE